MQTFKIFEVTIQIIAIIFSLGIGTAIINRWIRPRVTMLSASLKDFASDELYVGYSNKFVTLIKLKNVSATPAEHITLEIDSTEPLELGCVKRIESSEIKPRFDNVNKRMVLNLSILESRSENIFILLTKKPADINITSYIRKGMIIDLKPSSIATAYLKWQRQSIGITFFFTTLVALLLVLGQTTQLSLGLLYTLTAVLVVLSLLVPITFILKLHGKYRYI